MSRKTVLEMFESKLEVMQSNGDHWLSVPGIFQMLEHCKRQVNSSEKQKPNLPDIEQVAERVHSAWICEKVKQGITSRKSSDGREQMLPYSQLDDDLKELDRATVRAVYKAIGEL